MQGNALKKGQNISTFCVSCLLCYSCVVKNNFALLAHVFRYCVIGGSAWQNGPWKCWLSSRFKYKMCYCCKVWFSRLICRVRQRGRLFSWLPLMHIWRVERKQCGLSVYIMAWPYSSAGHFSVGWITRTVLMCTINIKGNCFYMLWFIIFFFPWSILAFIPFFCYGWTHHIPRLLRRWLSDTPQRSALVLVVLHQQYRLWSKLAHFT